MDPQEKALLNRIMKTVEENNKKISTLYRAYRFSTILRIIYWLIIIGVALGSFYFIQPYIAQIDDAFTGLRSGTDRVNDVLEGIKGVMNKNDDPAMDQSLE